MPTIITHALLPLIAGTAAGRERVSPKLVVAGMVAAVLPDADVVGFRFGIPYGDELGHRGATHSLAFAFLCGLLAMTFAGRLRSAPWPAFLFVSAATASHGLTDMLTNGGKGVALWWPFSDQRLFWPIRSVDVSSIGLNALTNGSMTRVLTSEFIWLLLPAAIIAILFRGLAPPHIDLARGQS